VGQGPLLPGTPFLPRAPQRPEDVLQWSRDLHRAVQDFYVRLVDRMETQTLEGTLAERPSPNGTRRFFFATDTNELYYDKGTWVLI
jgi:hypothetical protein